MPSTEQRSCSDEGVRESTHKLHSQTGRSHGRDDRRRTHAYAMRKDSTIITVINIIIGTATFNKYLECACLG